MARGFREDFREAGFVLLRGAISQPLLGELQAAVAPLLAHHTTGRSTTNFGSTINGSLQLCSAQFCVGILCSFNCCSMLLNVLIGRCR